MGDVKMALMMGAYLGSSIIVAFFVAFLAGGLGGLLLMGLGVKGRKDRIPFGPYLALGSVVAALLGSRIIEAYLDVAM
jgi:leader peptidase (prepilin peptidase)/N-methyltransferase